LLPFNHWWNELKGFRGEAERISLAAQLAIILEVSAYPKPGNVSRFHPFKDTSLDHFLAGGVAVGPAIRRAALKGLKAGAGRLPMEKVGLGLHVLQAVKDSQAWHSGGNTNFGTLLLLVPMAAAAGFLKASGKTGVEGLGETVKRMVEQSTVEDAVSLYRAVRVAGVGGLGKPPRGLPDSSSSQAVKELRKQGLTLHTVLKGCASYDVLCRELVEGLPLTLKEGYPILLEAYRETGDLNRATVQAYLHLLASHSDTLIARKAGMREAEKVSKMASKVLKLGGALTKKGLKEAERMDGKLKTLDNRLNPGATADLTAAALMVFLLAGFKP
jgi:triphosphoribosyl-dephospho-CoA synthase